MSAGPAKGIAAESYGSYGSNRPAMPEDMLFMLHMEGSKLLACPLNKSVFEFADDDFVESVVITDPETYYTDTVMQANMNLVF